jgi:NAD(P)-dependent dehydrogenase (short-subunit alcohol dehydrogenase family)
LEFVPALNGVLISADTNALIVIPPIATSLPIPLTHPIGRMATIHEIGELVGFLCSDKPSFITGASYVIDGGLTTQLPNKLA